VGRRRKQLDPDKPLPPGLYPHGNQFRARVMGGEWVYFGTDYVEAVRGYAAWRRDGAKPDTIGWLLDLFAGPVCAGKVKAGTLAKRTAKDYSNDAEMLKTGLGHIPMTGLRPMHVTKYRDERAQSAPSHVRNEIAALSAALAWAVEAGKIDSNPCLQVDWPSKKVRTRLISDDEYLTVFEKAGTAVRLAMSLGVRTLALPGDLLKMGPRNVIRVGEKRLLRFSRNKTDVPIEIEVVGELAQLIDAHLAESVVHTHFVHRRDGKPFTVDGIGAMFRRYCGEKKANVKDFGIRDLRAKGATDMYRAGVPIRHIQNLLGHKSVRTTEIYLKQLVPDTVRPNEQAIIASAK